MSISGGLDQAFERIDALGGNALQIYTKNQRRWRAPPLTQNLVTRFQRRRQESGPMPVAIHAAYLINLAALNRKLRDRSVAAFADELRRAELLGIGWVVLHPGAHLGAGVGSGLARLARNLDRSITVSGTTEVMVLIENTAGQGTCLAAAFWEIAEILSRSRHESRLGVCFDTCHAFSAGYDMRTPAAYAAMMDRFDHRSGLERIKLFHLNDSKRALGSRIDRHQHIGKGKIGLEGFRLLVNDERFHRHPMILETPKGKGLHLDRENLEVLRGLMNHGPTDPPKRTPEPVPRSVEAP